MEKKWGPTFVIVHLLKKWWKYQIFVPWRPNSNYEMKSVSVLAFCVNIIQFYGNMPVILYKIIWF